MILPWSVPKIIQLLFCKFGCKVISEICVSNRVCVYVSAWLKFLCISWNNTALIIQTCIFNGLLSLITHLTGFSLMMEMNYYVHKI